MQYTYHNSRAFEPEEASGTTHQTGYAGAHTEDKDLSENQIDITIISNGF